MKTYEYHDQGQCLSFIILEKITFSFEKAHVDKFSLRDCTCIHIIKQYTCIYDISNLIISVKGCF